MKLDLIFYQLFEKETSTYTYLVADPVSKEAVIIDPVKEMVDRDLKLIDELGVKLKYVLETHVHADHVTGAGVIRKKTGARIAQSSASAVGRADLLLDDGMELKFGGKTLKGLSVPGHTNGCMTYLIENKAFTGDTLMVRGCGRTDFQEGSSERLFQNVREKLFQLPDETEVWPAHDYKGHTKSTIGMEKKFNPRLNLEVTEEGFKEIMNNLKLDYPKKIDVAVPMNLQCGLSPDDQ